jgi:uracil-DNA glycosylase
MPGTRGQLRVLNAEIVACRKCPRLVRYREKIAREKRRAFRDWEYWGRPVPGFGDARAELLILGLAPAAHGANRTGRMFTGDRSGDFLYKALHRAGFANQPASIHRGDGLALKNAYISATLRCAPPANTPLPGELRNCRPYLERELSLLRPRAVLALGKIAFDAYLKLLKDRGVIERRSAYAFRHGASYHLPCGLEALGPKLFASYHPSQQNTFTGKLTEAMFFRLLCQIQQFLDRDRGQ